MTTGTDDTRGIEHYLLNEMPENTREKFEERLLVDDDLFYEVANAENAMIDRFVRGEMAGDERRRFETSVVGNPSRASKVANAAALRDFIDAERRVESSNSETFLPRLFAGLDFRSPSMGFAAAGILIAFSFLAAYLFVQNRSLGSQVARLESELANTGRQSGLEQQLAASRTREAELQSQIDEEKSVTGDLTTDLERERANRRNLETEIAAMRREKPDLPVHSETPEVAPPVILAMTLKPAGGKGGGMSSLKLSDNTKRVAILLALPALADENERYSVRLNGTEIARNLAAKTGPLGTRAISVWIVNQQLRAGENLIESYDSKGRVAGEYRLAVNKELR